MRIKSQRKFNLTVATKKKSNVQDKGSCQYRNIFETHQQLND